LRAAHDNALDFLFQIDDPSPLAIDDDFYESLASYKVRESEKATLVAYAENKFYNQLPPRLQESLIQTTLKKHLNLLDFFFVDYDTGYAPVKAIQRRMVTSLQYSLFAYGECVLRRGYTALGVIFMKDNGVSVLGVKESVRLMDLYDHSFIGEFEVIFKQPAERSYIAVNR